MSDDVHRIDVSLPALLQTFLHQDRPDPVALVLRLNGQWSRRQEAAVIRAAFDADAREADVADDLVSESGDVGDASQGLPIHTRVNARFLSSDFVRLQCVTRDGVAFDARAFGSRFPIPIFIFQGIDDLNTPTELVRRWFDGLTAPSKRMIVVEHASHGAFYTYADQLGQLLTYAAKPISTH